MTIELERASARTGEFARLAAAIDEAEAVAWDRIGGPTNAELAAIRRREVALPAPVTLGDWQWLARRLARAIENEWSAEAAAPLLRWAS